MVLATGPIIGVAGGSHYERQLTCALPATTNQTATSS